MHEAILEPQLAICDPHHHLWDFPTNRYLLPELLADLESGHLVEDTVFIECGAFYRADGPADMRFVGETEFVNGAAAMAASGRYGPVRACAAIVGRADLATGAGVERVLEAHIAAAAGRFRGIRHAAGWDASDMVRNSHTDPPAGLYQTNSFRDGFAKLAPLGLTFEAWQYHPQLPELAALADAFPDTKIVLNHVGGPLGIGPYAAHREHVLEDWSRDIRALAKRANVWVKLGGLGMPLCGFGHHKRSEQPRSSELAAAWRPYVETCIEAFGVDRSMFESNFPVDKASCSYAALWNAFKLLAQGASREEKASLFHGAARHFYRLG